MSPAHQRQAGSIVTITASTSAGRSATQEPSARTRSKPASSTSLKASSTTWKCSLWIWRITIARPTGAATIDTVETRDQLFDYFVDKIFIGREQVVVASYYYDSEKQHRARRP